MSRLSPYGINEILNSHVAFRLHKAFTDKISIPTLRKKLTLNYDAHEKARQLIYWPYCWRDKIRYFANSIKLHLYRDVPLLDVTYDRRIGRDDFDRIFDKKMQATSWMTKILLNILLLFYQMYTCNICLHHHKFMDT